MDIANRVLLIISFLCGSLFGFGLQHGLQSLAFTSFIIGMLISAAAEIILGKGVIFFMCGVLGITGAFIGYIL